MDTTTVILMFFFRSRHIIFSRCRSGEGGVGGRVVVVVAVMRFRLYMLPVFSRTTAAANAVAANAAAASNNNPRFCTDAIIFVHLLLIMPFVFVAGGVYQHWQIFAFFRFLHFCAGIRFLKLHSSVASVIVDRRFQSFAFFLISHLFAWVRFWYHIDLLARNLSRRFFLHA